MIFDGEVIHVSAHVYDYCFFLFKPQVIFIKSPQKPFCQILKKCYSVIADSFC